MLQKSTGSDEEKSVTRIDCLTQSVFREGGILHRVCFKTNPVQDIRYDIEAHLHIVLQYNNIVLYIHYISYIHCIYFVYIMYNIYMLYELNICTYILYIGVSRLTYILFVLYYCNCIICISRK